MKLSEILLFKEKIQDFSFIELTGATQSLNRLYYKKDKERIYYNFVCLRMDGYPANILDSQNRWESSDSISATFYGTVDWEGLRTICTTDGDIADIGTNSSEDLGILELSSCDDLIKHLNLIKNLELVIKSKN